MTRLLKSIFSAPNLKKSATFHKTIIKDKIHRILHAASFPTSSLLLKDQTTIADALALCTDPKKSSLLFGTQVHGQVFKLGFPYAVFSQNNLIRMYIKCDQFSDGLRVFDEMHVKNLVSWTLVISGTVGIGESELGFEAFLEMMRSGLVPNEFALGSVMKMCIENGASGQMLGFCIHCFAMKIGLEKNPFVGSSTIYLYAKGKHIEAAEKVFEYLENLGDVGCWNAMIGGYALCGFVYKAAKTVYVMQLKGMRMDEFTFVSALNACSCSVTGLDFGEQIYGLIVKCGMEQISSVANSIMDMYFKSGEKECALTIFNAMVDKDVVSWNTVFAGLTQCANEEEVLGIFHQFMLSGWKPGRVTFSILFRLCGEIGNLGLGLQFYCLAYQLGFSTETQTLSSLINMFSRCGAIEIARKMFDNSPYESESHLIEMISGYNLDCDIEALRVFCKMWTCGIVSNDSTFSVTLEACFISENLGVTKQLHGITTKLGLMSYENVLMSLIKVYVKFGLVTQSFGFFNDGGRIPNVLSWGVLISELVHQGYNYEAMSIMNLMTGYGVKADDFILITMLKSSTSLTSYHLAKSLHAVVIKLGHEENVYVATAVIDAYSKCGELNSAIYVFSQSSESADVVLFNTMIMAYAHHGLIKDAMETFGRMKSLNIKPSQATFVSVLSACRHMGLVDLGRSVFKSIKCDFDMEPSPHNYGCLVDLFARNGFLRDAKRIIENMRFLPWPALLRSLLNGCRIHGDRQMGEWAARNLLELLPDDNAAYILLSKVYSEDRNWEDAAKMKIAMIGNTVRKELGSSWIEL